ncbi:MAG: long-chain fatty acid--CoA ligase [Phycisphaerales bacterium]
MVDDRRSYTGAELIVAAFHVADEIEKRSSAPHIGLMLPTSAAFPIAALASWMLGRVIVPLNYLLKQEELDYVVEHSGIDAVVTVGPMLDAVGYRPSVPAVIEMDKIDYKSVPPLRWPALKGNDELAALLYTSGTTGKPKGVMLTHGNLISNIHQGAQGMQATKHDTFLGVLPQFHCFGVTQLTLTPLVYGAKVVYTARFSPPKIFELARDHHATVFIGIPSMYAALVNAKSGNSGDFATMKIMVSGAEPLPDATLERFREKFGIKICEGFGMTELSPATNVSLPDCTKRHSVGRPLPSMEQRIVDPATEREVSVGQEGELRLRGPNLMAGYYKRAEDTAKTIDSQGFMRTGDIARIDDDGYLYITGRIKEMIIVGGENVFPREVEEVLNKHEAVDASGVIGVHDPMRGEVIVAFVELVEGGQADPNELRVWCRDQLPGYKCPREVHIVDALPRNPVGKILRKDLHTMLPVQAEG